VSVPSAVAVSDVLDSDPIAVSEDADLSMKVLNLLESKDKVKKSSVLGWIRPAALQLALSAHGCRIVQKAFDVACGDEKRGLAIKLHGHVRELLESQHGNHVLQKCIEVLPPQSVQFIVDELEFWPMSWVGVAKHRFGCRVIERLLEHCPEDMTAPLTDAVVSDASALARHPYGNYVVQHVLEYGTDVHRKSLISALVDTGIAFLAQHRIASNVIESALGRVCSADQQTIGLALLGAPQTLLVVGCSRYGTHVINRLLEVLAPGPLRVEVVRQLLSNLPQIMESKHSKQLVEKLKSLGFD
jgi:pumilio RNA-binding family